tara:strand:+ start:1041 stop:1658 length:618 start_codon:yes stop_codon:yes gene_type:complete
MFDGIENPLCLVFDNLVPIKLQDKIENICISNQFSWFYTKATVTEGLDLTPITPLFPNIKDYIQFCHVMYIDDKINSDYFNNASDIIQNLFDKLQINNKKFIRIKANLQTQCHGSQKKHHNIPHKDYLQKHYVALYYINDSDGDTIIFGDSNKQTRIKPKKGRFLLFDGNLLHTSCHPIKNDKRMVINYNFQCEDINLIDIDANI